MEIGVSTASLFMRCDNLEAMDVLNGIDARVVEVFLESYREYRPEYGRKLLERKGNLKVHSLHTLTTQFEPQLFALNAVAYEDAVEMFRGVLEAGRILGASCYTLHGRARVKKTGFYDNYKVLGPRFEELCSLTKEYGIDLCLENVEWSQYNRVGFLDEIKGMTPSLKTTLDIKQARLSGCFYGDYITEMGERIRTVHLSDIREDGKMCLPGKGTFDFDDLFRRLKDVGFSGNMLVEAYEKDYEGYEEIRESLEFLRELKEKIF